MKDKPVYIVSAEETYHYGQVIYAEGNSGDWVYVIVSGSVEISRTFNGEKSVIEVLKEGEVFGELGFLEGIKRTATAAAVGETTVGLIDRESLDFEFNRLSSEFRIIIKAIVERSKKLLDKAYESKP